MPQYKNFQYGIGQYGVFEDIMEGSSSKLLFLKSRFGVLKGSEMLYLYQHTPAKINGQPKRMRLASNLGDTLYKEHLEVAARTPQLRIKSNLSDDWLISQEY